MDGIIDESEYVIQKGVLQDKLDSLVIPQVDSTMKAGELVENLGMLWDKATLQERREILYSMVDAVFLDMWVNKSVVGIQPRPAFYPLFKALQQDGQVTIFDPNEVTKGGRCGGDGGGLNSPSRRGPYWDMLQA